MQQALGLPPLTRHPPTPGWPCRLPPDDIVPDGGELLDREYILAPGAALMLDAAPRPPLQALPPSARASAVYQRLGQA